MVESSLPEHLIAAGRELLRTADEVGLNPQIAAWLYDHERGEWRYVLVTPLVDTIGRRRLYSNLSAAFSKMNIVSELDIADVHLESPRSPIVALFQPFHLKGETTDIRDCIVHGVRFDAIVYRSILEPSENVERQGRQFLRRTHQYLGT